MLRAILGERFKSPEHVTLSKGKRSLRYWLFAMVLFLLFVSVARPSWGLRILPFSGKGRDLLIVLDVSKSMLAQDVKPSRLEHAKWFIRELVKATLGDRYGIVAFSGSAFLECPLTIDKTSLFQTLDELSPGSIPLGGTNIQNALEIALKAFEAAEGAHRAIILITDGDELQGDSTTVIKELQDRKIPLFVVGIGDPSNPSVIMFSDQDNPKNTSFLRDNSGELVKSRLNETQLNKLAMETSGIYVRSTVTSPCLDPIKKRISDLVPEKYQSGKNTRPIERFHVPLFGAVILMLIYLAVSERRKTVKTAMMFFAIFAIANFATAGNNPPDIYNKAVELQKENKTDDASQLYQKAVNQTADTEVRARAFQNLGVITHSHARETMKTMNLDKALEELQFAEEMYRQSMSSAPEIKDVAMNQQKLLNDRKIIEEMKKKQQEMQDKQKDAQKKIKDAMDKNKEAQQNQNQNQQQQSKENNSKKEAEKKTEEAKKSTEDLKNEAQKQGSKNTEQAAENAEKELDKAKNEQHNDNFDKAEDNLKKALDALGGDKDKQQQKEKNQQQSQKDKQEEKDKNKNQQNQVPEDLKPKNGQKEKEDKDIDPKQAEALLDLMAQDEKDLRDELKERQRQNSTVEGVDKDW